MSAKTNNTALGNFLKINYYQKNKETQHTHTRIPSTENNVKGGTYYISNEKTTEFNKLYYENVFTNNKQEYLTEKQLDNGVIYHDLDLKYDMSINERQHNNLFLDTLVSLYSDNIKKLLNLPNYFTFKIFIMHKPNVNTLPDITKDGIHIIINILLNTENNIRLREMLLADINIQNLFKSINITNALEDVFDNTIIRRTTNVQLFGSRKPAHSAYQLTHIYKITHIENVPKKIPNTIFNKLLYNKLNKIVNNGTKFITELELNPTMTFQLFNELSVRNINNRENCELRPIVIEPIIEIPMLNEYNEIIAYVELGILYSIFTKIQGQDKWRKIGILLKNTNHSKALGLFHDLSKQNSPDKYNEEHVNKLYQSFKLTTHSNGKPITIASLIKFYKDVNQPLTKIIMQEIKKQQPSNNLNENNIILERPFEIVCAEFELTHSKLNNKSCFVKEDNHNIHIMTRTQLTTTYENKDYQVIENTSDGQKIGLRPFIIRWLSYPNMRTYDDVGIYPPPLKCPANILNIWKPFRAELITEFTEKPDVIPRFINHIKVLSGNDDIVCDYLIKWFAQMLQFPAIKTICPVLISKQGAGKGRLTDFLKKLFGDDKYFESTNPSRDIWGSFNSKMASAYFVNLNELSKKDTIDSMGLIKGQITDNNMIINEKGRPQYEIQSYHRNLISTNSEEPIPTSKDDRRFLIIRCSDELIGNTHYFNEYMRDIVNDDNAVRTIYNYLMNIPDMDKFHNIPLPKTDYHNDLQELSINPIENWLKSFVEEHIDEDADIKFKSSDIYSWFNTWINTNKVKYDVNNIQFSVRLKRLNIEGIESCKGTHGVRELAFNFTMLKKYFNLGCLLDV